MFNKIAITLFIIAFVSANKPNPLYGFFTADPKDQLNWLQHNNLDFLSCRVTYRVRNKNTPHSMGSLKDMRLLEGTPKNQKQNLNRSSEDRSSPLLQSQSLTDINAIQNRNQLYGDLQNKMRQDLARDQIILKKNPSLNESTQELNRSYQSNERVNIPNSFEEKMRQAIQNNQAFKQRMAPLNMSNQESVVRSQEDNLSQVHGSFVKPSFKQESFTGLNNRQLVNPLDNSKIQIDPQAINFNRPSQHSLESVDEYHQRSIKESPVLNKRQFNQMPLMANNVVASRQFGNLSLEDENSLHQVLQNNIINERQAHENSRANSRKTSNRTDMFDGSEDDHRIVFEPNLQFEKKQRSFVSEHVTDRDELSGVPTKLTGNYYVSVDCDAGATRNTNFVCDGKDFMYVVHKSGMSSKTTKINLKTNTLAKVENYILDANKKANIYWDVNSCTLTIKSSGIKIFGAIIMTVMALLAF